MKKLGIRIKLFFVFLRWCYNDIRENWGDMKLRYFNETDPGMIRLFKEIEDELE